MIRDVSKQYAALFNEAEEEDKKYTKACEKACKEAEYLKQKEIDEFDEEEINLDECGFTENEVQVNEVVDPLRMWQDMKSKQKGPSLVKVDNNYINAVKKLLSGIKSSKRDVYNRICGPGGKLEQYKQNRTELPPPEDFAENFISFDEIQKILSHDKKLSHDDKNLSHDNDIENDSLKDFDSEETGKEDVSLASRAAKETSDTNNPFGNDMAMANLYDSELTEAEEQNAIKKAKNLLVKSKKEVNDATYKFVKKFLEKNSSKIQKAISKIKNEDTKDGLKKLFKTLEKYSKGNLSESMIVERDSEKGNRSGPLVQFIKSTLRMFNWLLMIIPAGLLSSAWVIKSVANITSGLLKQIDKGLAESLTLEICDDEDEIYNEDVEELDETGCNKKKFDEDEIDEADYREHASHFLDPIGVKASTASLKGQDTAAISVVEKLLSKIEKLESKIEFFESRAEKNGDDAATSKSVNETDEIGYLDAEEDDEIEIRKKDIDSSKMRFKSDLDKLSKSQLEKVFDGLVDKIQDSLDRQKKAGADPSGTKHTPKEIADAVKKINWFRELSYEKELTEEQKKEFADLVYKFWYDWITVEEIHDGEKINVPVKSIKDMLTQPFKSFFGRPDNHVCLAKEFKIYDNGNVYTLQPFQYTRDPYEELKTTKARRERITAQKLQKAADEGKGFKPERGKRGSYVIDKTSDEMVNPSGHEKGTWSINDWNHMIGTLSPKRQKEIEDELRADISKEAGSDEFKKARELAFLKMIFNRAGKAGSSNSDYFNKAAKEKRKKLRQLNAMKKDFEKQLEEISSKIEKLDKRKAELEKILKNDPDNDDADSELVDVKWDLEDAWREYDDKVDTIRDMAENADDYLDKYAPEDDDDEEEEYDDKKLLLKTTSSDGKVKAQDLRKFSNIATVDLAPTFADRYGKPYDVHAYRSYEKHTIDMILQALSDVTGITDEKKLLNALVEMPEIQFNQFLKELKTRSQSKAAHSSNRSNGTPKKVVKNHRPQALF